MSKLRLCSGIKKLKIVQIYFCRLHQSGAVVVAVHCFARISKMSVILFIPPFAEKNTENPPSFKKSD
jgi:hypothetical protein